MHACKLYGPDIKVLLLQNIILALLVSVTDLSKAVFVLWFSVACFWCQSLVTFHLMLVHIIFSSVLVAEWLPFGKELFTG